MNGMARMMMVNAARSGDAEGRRKTVIVHENDRTPSGYNMGGYNMGGYDMGGYDMNYGTESRRYKNGRFAPKNEDSGRAELRLIGFDRGQDVYPDEHRIEFGGDRVGTTYDPPHMNEMSHRTSPMKQMRKPQSKMAFGPEMAKEWMQGMHFEKWSLDEVKALLRQKGIEEDPYEVWVGMNALYSDIGKTCEKYGMSAKEFFLEAALAYWLYDKDAVDDKLGAYFECIVRK